MGIYYPQAVISLRVLWEDWKAWGMQENLPEPLSVFKVIPKNVKVKINDYTEADTFTAEIDYKDFPFDPRAIKSCGVTIHMDDMQKLFAGHNSENESERNEIVPSDKNTIFMGFADTDKISLDASKRLVTLEGRDFTCLFTDRDYFGPSTTQTDPKNVTALSETLETILKRLILEVPGAMKLKSTATSTDRINAVVDYTQKNFGPILEDITKLSPDMLEPIILVDNRVYDDAGNKINIPNPGNLKQSNNKLDNNKNTRPKASYWEHIQALVEHMGLICYMELDKLVLTKPRNIYAKGGKNKLFVYGKNLSSLEFSRKLGRQKGFNIRMLCFNPEDKVAAETNGGVIDVRIPEEATEVWLKKIGISKGPVMIKKVTAHQNNAQQGTGASGEAQGEPAPYITFRVTDVKNREELIDRGQSVFEEISRQQIEGSFETKEMQTCEAGTDADFSLLKMRNGTPVELVIDQGDMQGLNQRIMELKDKTLSNERRTREAFLISRGFEGPVAASMAIAMTYINTPFYTRAVEFSLDQENGFDVKVDFINFIEIKGQAKNA